MQPAWRAIRQQARARILLRLAPLKDPKLCEPPRFPGLWLSDGESLIALDHPPP
jgi:hypothetical protein